MGIRGRVKVGIMGNVKSGGKGEGLRLVKRRRVKDGNKGKD